MYFLGGCLFELVTFLVRGALVIPITCMIFQSPSIDVIKMFIPTVFLPETARLCNSLPAECFPWNYDLNGFKV